MDKQALTGFPLEPLVSAEPAAWPAAASLEGRHVRLEALSAERHANNLWETTGGQQNAGLWQYLPEGPFLDRSHFEHALRGAASHKDPVFFAVVDRNTARAVGRLALLNIRQTHRVVEVGHIIFSAGLQRTRGATEALYLLSQYVFEDLAYRRYEWKCNALNSRSRSAALRYGFEFEGIFRQHMIVKGRNRDTAWFSMLDHAWPGIKSAMESWLKPENFDADGRQRQKLSDLTRSEHRQGHTG